MYDTPSWGRGSYNYEKQLGPDGLAYPQCMTPTGMKKPLENPATADMIGERRNAIPGTAQIRAIRRAIQVWFRAMLTMRT